MDPELVVCFLQQLFHLPQVFEALVKKEAKGEDLNHGDHFTTYGARVSLGKRFTTQAGSWVTAPLVTRRREQRA